VPTRGDRCAREIRQDPRFSPEKTRNLRIICHIQRDLWGCGRACGRVEKLLKPLHVFQTSQECSKANIEIDAREAHLEASLPRALAWALFSSCCSTS
jgi:hypothetical protein